MRQNLAQPFFAVFIQGLFLIVFLLDCTKKVVIYIVILFHFLLGEPVAVMHGANAPLLQRMIEKEIRKERQVLKGEATREPICMEDAVPGK